MKSCSNRILTALAILLAIGAAGAYASLSFFATVKVLIKLGFSLDFAVTCGYVSGISAAIYSLSTKGPAMFQPLPNQISKLCCHPLTSLESLYTHYRTKTCKNFILTTFLGLTGIISSFFNSLFTGLGAFLGIDLLAESNPELSPYAVGISIFLGTSSFVTNMVFGTVISLDNFMRLSRKIMEKCCLTPQDIEQGQPILEETTVTQILRELDQVALAPDRTPEVRSLTLTKNEKQLFDGVVGHFRQRLKPTSNPTSPPSPSLAHSFP